MRRAGYVRLDITRRLLMLPNEKKIHMLMVAGPGIWPSTKRGSPACQDRRWSVLGPVGFVTENMGALENWCWTVALK
jgi:hypothetical protein